MLQLQLVLRVEPRSKWETVNLEQGEVLLVRMVILAFPVTSSRLPGGKKCHRTIPRGSGRWELDAVGMSSWLPVVPFD